MATHKQDPSAILDWSMDWTAQLAANGGATISSATVVCSNEHADVSDISHNNTVVTWRLAVEGITTGALTHTVHVVLSTGEQDERDMTITVANT